MKKIVLVCWICFGLVILIGEVMAAEPFDAAMIATQAFTKAALNGDLTQAWQHAQEIAPYVPTLGKEEKHILTGYMKERFLQRPDVLPWAFDLLEQAQKTK